MTIERSGARRFRECPYCWAAVDFIVGDGMHWECPHCRQAMQFSILNGSVMAHSELILPSKLAAIGRMPDFCFEIDVAKAEGKP